MTTFQKYFLLTQAVLLALITGFGASYYWRWRVYTESQAFPILAEAFQILSDHALTPLPEDRTLEYGMIRGMLQAYGDPYTVFVEPAQHELESDELQGSFGGIGVRIGRDQDGNPILYPFPDGPASEAGIREGDQLLAIDDLQLTPATPDEHIQAALRGPVKSRLRLRVNRAGSPTPLEFVIQRAEILLPSVTWHQEITEPRLGVLEINLISASTPDEIRKAIQDLRNRGASAYVLDLRDNNGGLLEAGIETARLFLANGIVLQRQYRHQEPDTFRVDKPGAFADLPLAVWINHNTASAAEIIAGALQAHHRAPLIGTPTYGKDTIQLVFELQDHSSLHVTAGHWWLPHPTPSVSQSGLQPDIPLESKDSPAATEAAYIRAAIQTLFGDQ